MKRAAHDRTEKTTSSQTAWLGAPAPSLRGSARARLGRLAALAGLVSLSAALTTALIAEPDDRTLVIDGQTLTTEIDAPEGAPYDKIYSGWRFRNPETQRLQQDDFENPAFTVVERGEELWSTVDGAAGKSCVSCHGDASESMKGVRATMPKWHAASGKPRSLPHVINTCRENALKADPWTWESENMLAMSAFIGVQSRGMPLNVQTDGPMTPWFEKGKKLYYTRFGQLDVACANCHENSFGKRIRADHLSQGMVNGFPTYRFKWQKVGSMHRRFKGCMKNIRATPFKPGSDEFVALELYVASRGNGLSVETPSVRN